MSQRGMLGVSPEVKNALTVGTNIKLSFLKDRDPPLHTGGPPADVAEDEAEQVGGGHIESHHYLGLVGEREGREAEHTFSHLHHPLGQPKRQQLGSLLPKQHATAPRGDKHTDPTARSTSGCCPPPRGTLGDSHRGSSLPVEGGGKAVITAGRCCGTAEWLSLSWGTGHDGERLWEVVDFGFSVL